MVERDTLEPDTVGPDVFGDAEVSPDASAPPVVAVTWLSGALLPGGDAPVDVGVDADGLISSISPHASVAAPEGATLVDLTGKWLAPAFIDSHVHLAYLPKAAAMAAGGVAAVVDMAAPVSFFDADYSPLLVKGSGPMVTAVGGYPTASWGAGGYGFECADDEAAKLAVTQLVGMGAALIKLPVAGGPQLNEPALVAAVTRAHELGVKVASHALGDTEAELAATVGADLLAHTPVVALGDDAAWMWADRAVVSSLRAFGGQPAAVDNLAKLRAAGATVLYGTDFGNTQTAGIDGIEIGLMQAAGMSGAEILAAGTAIPAAYWGFDGLGAIEVGRRASLVVLVADPHKDPKTLAQAEQVWLDGALLP